MALSDRRARPLATLAWVWEHLIAAPVGWFFHHTAPLWRAPGRALIAAGDAVVGWVLWPLAKGLRWFAVRFYRWVLRPVALVLAAILSWTMRD